MIERERARYVNALSAIEPEEALKEIRQFFCDLMDVYEQSDTEVPIIKAYKIFEEFR